MLSELEALGLSGLKVQEQALREFTEAELFHTMSIQNRFSVWKQVEVKSQQRSSVFAVHSAVGSREAPDHKSWGLDR